MFNFVKKISHILNLNREFLFEIIIFEIFQFIIKNLFNNAFVYSKTLLIFFFAINVIFFLIFTNNDKHNIQFI